MRWWRKEGGGRKEKEIAGERREGGEEVGNRGKELKNGEKPGEQGRRGGRVGNEKGM